MEAVGVAIGSEPIRGKQNYLRNRLFRILLFE